MILSAFLVIALPAAAQTQRPVVVEVTRDGAEWTATYRFPRSSPIWLFPRSAVTEHAPRQPWRPQSWRVTTPGVRLDRIGHYDVLRGEGGIVPVNVTIRFTPSADVLVADYTPALVFSDGSVALFDQHFTTIPAASADEVAALPMDLNGQPDSGIATQVTFRDEGGPVFHAGRRQVEVTVADAGTYVLLGATQPLVTDALAAMIDPGLPEWLRTALTDLTPPILSRYAQLMGPAPGGKPTILASWMGPTAGLNSMNGGVVPSTIIMRFEGEGIVADNPELGRSIRWFVAHEGAHFWIGQAVGYEFSRDAWITEGGAELLAIRTVQALDPAYDWRGALNALIAECARLTDNRPLATAEERGENRAYYACGALFGLLVEGVSGRPFDQFVRGLILANRDDRIVTRAEWLAAFEAAGGTVQLRREMEALLDGAAPARGLHLASLLRRAGIAFTIGEDGVPVLS